MTTKNPKRPRKAATMMHTLPDARLILARRLDLLAGIELAHGHHGAGEFLAHKAAALREVAR